MIDWKEEINKEIALVLMAHFGGCCLLTGVLIHVVNSPAVVQQGLLHPDMANYTDDPTAMIIVLIIGAILLTPPIIYKLNSYFKGAQAYYSNNSNKSNKTSVRAAQKTSKLHRPRATGHGPRATGHGNPTTTSARGQEPKQ